MGQSLSEPSSTTSSQRASPFSMFQQPIPTGLDPFAQVGHRPPPVSLQSTIQLKTDPTKNPQQPPQSSLLQQQPPPPTPPHQVSLPVIPSLQQPQYSPLIPTSHVVSTLSQLHCMNPVSNSVTTPGGPPLVGPPPTTGNFFFFFTL